MSGPASDRGVIDFVLPGARRLRAEPAAGAPILLAWLALWAVVAFRAGRVLDTLRGGAWDEWLALFSLLGALFLLVRAGPPRAARGGPSDRPTRWGPGWRAFRRHRLAMMGLGLVGAMIALALLTPYLAQHDPAAQGADLVASRLQPPSWEHPMGTDRLGRDVLSRVLHGGRVSLAIGIFAVLLAITLGSAVGAVAGYARGWIDSVSMRTVDLLLSFPRLVLLITLVAFVEPSMIVIAIVLGLTGWMGTSRLVRGEVLSLREREFVQAARALGFGRLRILLRHVLPNVASPIIVAATLGVGNTILVEASLSFLGLGVQPPAPSWGMMVAESRRFMVEAPWVAIFPGLAIVLTVMSFNLVGDGLRDALDPRGAAAGPAAGSAGPASGPPGSGGAGGPTGSVAPAGSVASAAAADGGGA